MNTTDYLIDKYSSRSPQIILGMLRYNLYELFAELGFKVGCKVGFFRGRNASAMFRSIPELKLYGIEAYAAQPYSTRHKTVSRYDRNRKAVADYVRIHKIKYFITDEDNYVKKGD